MPAPDSAEVVEHNRHLLQTVGPLTLGDAVGRAILLLGADSAHDALVYALGDGLAGHGLCPLRDVAQALITALACEGPGTATMTVLEWRCDEARLRVDNHGLLAPCPGGTADSPGTVRVAVIRRVVPPPPGRVPLFASALSRADFESLYGRMLPPQRVWPAFGPSGFSGAFGFRGTSPDYDPEAHRGVTLDEVLARPDPHA